MLWNKMNRIIPLWYDSENKCEIKNSCSRSDKYE